MQNRYKKSTLVPTSSKTVNRKRSCDVYTNTDGNYVCQKCAEREKFRYTESDEFRASYLKSINYINCCHSLMNELLYRKTGKSSIRLPDMPNFLEVVTALRENSNNFSEKGVSAREDVNDKCDKGCGAEESLTTQQRTETGRYMHICVRKNYRW